MVRNCSVELWKQADEEVETLSDLMDKVRIKMNRKTPGSLESQPIKLDLRQCTWDQVMGEVHSVTTRWSTTPKRFSKATACLEKLGRNSDAFQSWLELLPGGDYGSR